MRRIVALISTSPFLKNSLVLFLGTLVVSVLNYFFHVFVGRMVTPQAYGEVESLISLLMIVSVPAATITLIATKFAASMLAERNTEGMRSLASYLNKKILLFGLPLLIVVLSVTPLVKNFLNIESTLPVVLLWVIMFLSFLSAAATGLLSGWQKFFNVNISGVTATIVKVGTVFLFIKAGFSVSGVLGSYALSLVIGYFLCLYFLGKMLPRGAQAEVPTESISFASLKSYILPAFYGTLAMAILGNGDMIFAKHHLDSVASGEYGALTVVAKSIFFATGVLTTVLFAMAAEESHRQGNATRTLRLATFLTLVVVVGSVAFFFLFPEFVMWVFFGEKYLVVSPFLGWFGVAAGAYSLGNLFLQYLLSIHETRVAYWYLALSSLGIAALFLWGEEIRAIIAITIAAQAAAIILGIIFIVRKGTHAQARLSRHPDF